MRNRKYLTRRTGKAFARLVLFSGFTFEALKFKWLAFAEPDAFGELHHEPPHAPTSFSAPEPRLRYPEANNRSNRLLYRAEDAPKDESRYEPI